MSFGWPCSFPETKDISRQKIHESGDGVENAVYLSTLMCFLLKSLSWLHRFAAGGVVSRNVRGRHVFMIVPCYCLW